MRMFFTFFWRMAKDYPGPMIIISLLMAFIGFTEGAIVALIVPLLGLAFHQQQSLGSQGFTGQATRIIENVLARLNLAPSLGVILVIIVAIFAIQGAVRFFQINQQLRVLKLYENRLVKRVFGAYGNASWSFFVANKVGSLVNVLAVETGRATAAFQFMLQFVAQFLVIISYLIISFLISWQITLGALVLGAVATLMLKRFVGKMEEYGAKTTQINNDFHALAFDFLSSAKMIKASATHKRALAHIDELNQQKTKLRYLSQLQGSFIPSFFFPLVMMMLAVLVYIGTSIWQIQFATMLIFIYLFYRLMPALSALQGGYQQALIFIPSLYEIDAIIDQAQQSREHEGTKKFAGLKKWIVFDHTSFAYYDDTNVLTDVSLNIHKGQTTAIVGASGAGKTSLVDLLLGLYFPQTGSIIVDGKPLSHYHLSSWRKHIGYLSQDIFFFHDSIRANLAWFKHEANEQELWEALRLAFADEFVKEMPQQLETTIGDRGVKLSGGQRQRLALARLILQNPDIIVLDEPTSALDSESETKIWQTITTHLAQKTKVIISHRLHSLKGADMIYVIDKGRIVQQGSWHALIKQQGVFSHLSK